MAFFRNEAAGARMIRLAGRNYKLVEPGETVEIDRRLVQSLPGGVSEVDEDGEAASVPPIPEALATLATRALPQHGHDDARRAAALDHDGDGKPGGSTSAIDRVRAKRAELKDLTGKNVFAGWGEDELDRRIAKAIAAKGA